MIDLITKITIIINRIVVPVLMMLTAIMFFNADDEEMLKKYKGFFYRLVLGLVLLDIGVFILNY